MNLDACWSEIGVVDVAPLLTHSLQFLDWSRPAYPDKPQRAFRMQEAPAARAIIHEVLSCLWGNLVTADAMLSRMLPGQSHGMHVDIQPAHWLTRVHVPLVTNAGCWMRFEDEASDVHLAVGKAYTFDATRRHAFGNRGDTERIHLIFDVLRG